MIIYKATNIITNKVYIGKTVKTLDARKSAHIRASKKHKHTSIFYNAINKYGEDNFNWEIIKICESLEDLNESEKEYIRLFRDNSYNINSGGRGGDNFTFNPKKDLIRDKISKTLTGRKVVFTEEHKKNLRVKHKPHKSMSPEGRKKHSDIMKKIQFGENNPAYRHDLNSEEIKKLRNEGSTIHSIAIKFNCSDTAIKNRLHKMGLK